MERTIQLVQPMKLAERKLLRVAAYARVSCDKDAMKHSLAAQISYYNEYIQRHSDWVFAGIYGQQAIANILFEEDAPTCLGGEWFSTTIRSMLRNEKYAGDLLLQKSFVTDHITKEVKKNKGEMPQFFIQDDHEAIVPHEVFEAVRRENARRAAKYGSNGGETSELTSLVRCGICGKNYRRKKARARWLWCCTTYNLRGKKYCASKSIPEETLRNACAQVLGLAEYDAEVVKNCIERIDAMPDNLLVFHLTDGSIHETNWIFPSRSESWTDEMRQKAAEQMRRRYAETGH